MPKTHYTNKMQPKQKALRPCTKKNMQFSSRNAIQAIMSKSKVKYQGSKKTGLTQPLQLNMRKGNL